MGRDRDKIIEVAKGAEIYHDSVDISKELGVTEEDALMARDLIFCLLGSQGNHIQMEENNEYSTNDVRHPSNKHLIQKILPLCRAVHKITGYIDQNDGLECGRIKNSLSSALSVVLSQFFTFVSELEANPDLSLSLLVNLTRQPLMTFLKLSELLDLIHDKRGVQVLNDIYTYMMVFRGIFQLKKVLSFIFESSSLPLIEFIQNWAFKGIIDDPYNEFFIQKNVVVTQEILGDEFESHFWSRGYEIVENMFPLFVPKSTVHNILTCGKMSFVLMSCGVPLKSSTITLENIQKTSVFESFLINSSKNLADYLRSDLMILAVIKNIRDVLFNRRGDWILSFIERASVEMSSSISNINLHILNTILCNSLPPKCSLKLRVSMGEDLLLDRIYKIHSVSKDHPEGLPSPKHVSHTLTNAWDYLLLEPQFEWPLSLVFNSTVLERYQLLFRTVLVWRVLEHQMSFKRRRSSGSRRIDRILFVMQQFISGFVGYASVMVFHPLWTSFEKAAKTMNIDDLLKMHDSVLDEAISGLMISEPVLFRKFNSILLLCRRLLEFLEVWEGENKDVANPNLYDLSETGLMVIRSGLEFEEMVKDLLDSIKNVSSRGGSGLLLEFDSWINMSERYS